MLWSAFLLGLGASLHCAGMCGPIVLALPLSTRQKASVIFQSLIYNIGRISAYALLGFVLGTLSWGISIAGFQNYLSIFIGTAILIFVLLKWWSGRQVLNKMGQSPFFTTLIATMKSFFTIKNPLNALFIGFLNGFLPCGLVYMALAGALSSGTALSGAVYMILFGLGTLPMMWSIMIFGKHSWLRRLPFQKLVTFSLVLLGAYLIYRGLSIQLPSSIHFWELQNHPILCH